jgi:hypothetical protein
MPRPFRPHVIQAPQELTHLGQYRRLQFVVAGGRARSVYGSRQFQGCVQVRFAAHLELFR